MSRNLITKVRQQRGRDTLGVPGATGPSHNSSALGPRGLWTESTKRITCPAKRLPGEAFPQLPSEIQELPASLPTQSREETHLSLGKATHTVPGPGERPAHMAEWRRTRQGTRGKVSVITCNGMPTASSAHKGRTPRQGGKGKRV